MKHFNIFLMVSLCIAGVALFLTKQDEYRNDKIQDYYTRQKETSSLKVKSTQEEILLVQTALNDLKTQENEECNALRATGSKERGILKGQLTESRTDEIKEREELRQTYRELKADLKNKRSEEETKILSKKLEIFAKITMKEEETNAKIAATSALISQNTRNMTLAENAIRYDADLTADEKKKRLRILHVENGVTMRKNKLLTESIQQDKNDFAVYKAQAVRILRMLDLAVHKTNTEFWKKANSLVLDDPKGLYKQFGEEIKLSLAEENVKINEIKENYRRQRKVYESDLNDLQEEKNRAHADLIAAMNALKEPPREDIDKIALINGGAAFLILIFGIFYFMYLKSTAPLID